MKTYRLLVCPGEIQGETEATGSSGFEENLKMWLFQGVSSVREPTKDVEPPSEQQEQEMVPKPRPEGVREETVVGAWQGSSYGRGAAPQEKK